jgi:type I restriction enzyme M protein
MERVSQRLTQRITALAERYATPLATLENAVSDMEMVVKQHLAAMGF